MRRVLVTGANRGLGLEFTQQLLVRGDHVLGACRDPERAAELQALASKYPGRLDVLRVDMSGDTSVGLLARTVVGRVEGLDLLVNNAGLNVRGERFGHVDGDALTACLHTNCIGPFLLAQALAPLLARGTAAIVANISSQLGSIARTVSFYTPSYAVSKAALNMASALLTHGLAPSGVRVVALHPGWVKTDMGGSSAPLQPGEAVQGMLQVLDHLGPSESGLFLDYQGHVMPW